MGRGSGQWRPGVTWAVASPGRREKSGGGRARGLEQGHCVDSGDVSEGNLSFVALCGLTDRQLLPGSYSSAL